MKLFSIAAFLATVVSTVNSIIVNTPTNVVECQPLLITWDPQGSAGPFFLSIVPGPSPSSPALYSWSDLTNTSFTWTVTEPAGTSLGLLLRDQIGATSQSAPFTVQIGTTECLNSTSSSLTVSSFSTLPSSSSSSSTSPTPLLTTTSTSSTTTTTPGRLTISSSTPPARSSTTSSPSPTSTGNSSGNTKNGALSNTVNFVSVGLLAALAGAILA